MPKLDLDSIPQNNATAYPPCFAGQVQERWKRRIGPVAGFTHIGASHVVLKPGAWSSHRHWHDGEDEMVVMLSGEAVLIEDADDGNGGRTLLRPGDICTWAAGVRNGHQLINESETDCAFLAISGGPNLGGGYPDVDMVLTADDRFTRRDGTDF